MIYTQIHAESFQSRAQVGIIRMAGRILTAWQLRGLGRLARLLGAVLGRSTVRLSLPGGVPLAMDPTDYYWCRVLVPSFSYEPPVAELLARARTRASAFIDCGANIGYWPVLLRSMGWPGSIVAVEPSIVTRDLIRENISSLGDNARLVERAVSCRVDEQVHLIIGEHHAAARIVESHGTEGLEPILTTTIDLLAESLPGSGDGLIIKLDVEGSEVAALRGATQTLGSRDVLLIYEDHGSDEHCTVTRFLLRELPDARPVLLSENGRIRIDSVEQLAKLKTEPARGYNLALSNCSAFDAVLDEIAWSEP